MAKPKTQIITDTESVDRDIRELQRLNNVFPGLKRLILDIFEHGCQVFTVKIQLSASGAKKTVLVFKSSDSLRILITTLQAFERDTTGIIKFKSHDEPPFEEKG